MSPHVRSSVSSSGRWAHVARVLVGAEPVEFTQPNPWPSATVPLSNPEQLREGVVEQ